MNDEDDKRYTEGKFITAPTIFPNNDIKCVVDKHRAQVYATTRNKLSHGLKRRTNRVAKCSARNPLSLKKRLRG